MDGQTEEQTYRLQMDEQAYGQTNKNQLWTWSSWNLFKEVDYEHEVDHWYLFKEIDFEYEVHVIYLKRLTMNMKFIKSI